MNQPSSRTVQAALSFLCTKHAPSSPAQYARISHAFSMSGHSSLASPNSSDQHGFKNSLPFSLHIRKATGLQIRPESTVASPSQVEKEKQTRAPWHREGSNVPPVRRPRSAGAMTKGRHSSLIYLITLPLTARVPLASRATKDSNTTWV